jgi:peptidoglycan hydrolase-like protein with peptidoglycan-binding domain
MQAVTPIIPETITVHLGSPDSAAANVTVPFADYIKNVASSEIYPTWPESSLRANMLAQISFALNRVYTEYYRSRGYNFDITSSTAYDQSFVNGRDIFENISRLADELFNQYVTRQGSVEPLFTQYCNGVTVTCGGLSQWGSVDLAEQGYTPYEILTYYYGDDINIVRNAPVEGAVESYPDRVLRTGSVGNDVRLVQIRLNRISKNYPSIPKITDPNGVFDKSTEDAVRAFQNIFGLDPDGAVGRGTWYQILRIYNSVKRLSELNSEGLTPDEVTGVFTVPLSQGDRGTAVTELQYFLSFISVFNGEVPPVTIDGIYGAMTKNAVEAFQKDYGLTVTGDVDEATWNSIYSAYRGMLLKLPEDYFGQSIVPYGGTPLVLGSKGKEVAALQEYLNYISDTYPAIPKLDADGVYGEATASAVRTFQQLFGYEPTGVAGAATYNGVVQLYDDLRGGNSASVGQYREITAR